MNKVYITGRTTNEIKLTQIENGDYKATFTIAVNGQSEKADFFNIVAWRKTAENTAKYVNKGDLLGISGHLHSVNYETKTGEKKSTVQIIADEIEFLTTKKEKLQSRAEAVNELRTELVNDTEEDLPF